MLPRRKNKKADVSTKSSADEAARNSESTAGSLNVSATLDSSGTLVIHGTVMAPINHHNDVTVGLSGRVVGKIKAKVIVIEGEVNGDLCATDLIRVTATGKVIGNLHAGRISTQSGAQLRGRIVMRHRPDQVRHLDESSVHRLLTQL